MHKRLLKAIFVASVFLLLNVGNGYSQSDRPKLDVGGHFTLIRFRDILSLDPNLVVNFNPPPARSENVTNAGFGARLSYNITDEVAVEGELNFFPADKDDFVEGGNKLQGLAGIKAGVRKESYGVFFKVRPGFVRFSSLIDCPQGSGPFGSCVAPSRTYQALDLGGVIEAYPSRRTVVRFDIGDTMIFTKDRFLFRPLPGDEFITVIFPGELKNNLQVSVGIGIRF